MSELITRFAALHSSCAATALRRRLCAPLPPRAYPYYAELATYFIIMTLLSGAALIRRTATALRQP